MKYIGDFRGQTWYFRSDVVLDSQLLAIAQQAGAKVHVAFCSQRNAPVSQKPHPIEVEISVLQNIRIADECSTVTPIPGCKCHELVAI